MKKASGCYVFGQLDYIVYYVITTGWLLKLKDVPKKDFKDLMNSEEYKAFIEKEL